MNKKDCHRLNLQRTRRIAIASTCNEQEGLPSPQPATNKGGLPSPQPATNKEDCHRLNLQRIRRPQEQGGLPSPQPATNKEDFRHNLQQKNFQKFRFNISRRV
ncbi:hypothetical protein CEXT_784031 [Caerostris extrusa]|uniref:Uncharacterized protein n=1 Tax=Caerostris extrusa TaxID=172846 RepID=A0AAV4Q1N1_CAEEX|nr:hypothetical protein CEXT_784031 [Caerostris extrusa]